MYDAVEPASVGSRLITDEAGSVTQCRYQLCQLSSMVEQRSYTAKVVGSVPTAGTRFFSKKKTLVPTK